MSGRHITTGILASNPSGGKAAVLIGGAAEVAFLPVSREVTLHGTTGEPVQVVWDGGAAYASALLGTGGALPAPPAEISTPAIGPEQSATTSGIVPVLPTWTGTFRIPEWRPDTSDLYQGDSSGKGYNYGCAFFGDQLSSLGTLTELVLSITRGKAGPAAATFPTMRLLGARAPGSWYPPVLGNLAGPALKPGESTNWVVPASWLDDLSEGGAAGGIGIGVESDDPYLMVEGLALRGAAAWTRTI